MEPTNSTRVQPIKDGLEMKQNLEAIIGRFSRTGGQWLHNRPGVYTVLIALPTIDNIGMCLHACSLVETVGSLQPDQWTAAGY